MTFSTPQAVDMTLHQCQPASSILENISMGAICSLYQACIWYLLSNIRKQLLLNSPSQNESN